MAYVGDSWIRQRQEFYVRPSSKKNTMNSMFKKAARLYNKLPNDLKM